MNQFANVPMMAFDLLKEKKAHRYLDNWCASSPKYAAQIQFTGTSAY
jgi:hypothetical protein